VTGPAALASQSKQTSTISIVARLDFTGRPMAQTLVPATGAVTAAEKVLAAPLSQAWRAVSPEALPGRLAKSLLSRGV